MGKFKSGKNRGHEAKHHVPQFYLLQIVGIRKLVVIAGLIYLFLLFLPNPAFVNWLFILDNQDD